MDISPHVVHCNKCIKSDCKDLFTDKCEIISCPECGSRLHSCKLEDHLVNICSQVVLPCINAQYGCMKKLRRCNRSAHLSRCPASVVVCGREWSHHVLSADEKKDLKKCGKSRQKIPSVPIPEEALDLLQTESDQNKIISSYEHSRKERTEQRTAKNPLHPLLPMREIYNKAGQRMDVKHIQDLGCDSSDEEKKIKAEKLKKKKSVFANCYICQIDPARQHLHTLGNDYSHLTHMKFLKRYPKPRNHLLAKYNLRLNLPISISEVVLQGENILHVQLGGTIYTQKCLKTIRRDEFANHHRSQHETSLNNLSELCLRCPNWSSGCEFMSFRLKPNQGKLRFTSFLDSYFNCRSDPKKEYNGKSLDQVPFVFLLPVFNFLPSCSIRSLSQTCRTLRENIYNYLQDRSIYEIVWKKVDGCWVEQETKVSFSISDYPTEMSWSPAADLSMHLQTCPYMEAYIYEQEKIPVMIRECSHPIFSNDNQPSVEEYERCMKSK